MRGLQEGGRARGYLCTEDSRSLVLWPEARRAEARTEAWHSSRCQPASRRPGSAAHHGGLDPGAGTTPAPTYPAAAALTAALGSLKLLPLQVLPALEEAACWRHTSCGKAVWATLPYYRPGRRREEEGTVPAHRSGKLCSL